MKDKEKQIEEMADIIAPTYTIATKWFPDKYEPIEINVYADEIAKVLYDHNCRILDKDSVVLSRKKYQKKLDESYSTGYYFGKKETAEKIIHDLDMKISNYAMVLDLPELPEKIRLIPTEVMVHFVKTLKEQFGVEIKES